MAEQVVQYGLTTLQRVKDILFDPSLSFTITGNLTSGSNVISSAVVQTGKVARLGQVINDANLPAGTTITGIAANTITLSVNATGNASGEVCVVIDQPSAFDTVLTRYINAVTEYISQECNGRIFVQKTYTNDTYSIETPRQTFLILRQYPVISISSFQWRAGTPTNPNWTSFSPDQYELIDPVTDPISNTVWYPKGIIRVYGVLPRIYNNMIRVTYVAGYAVDWTNTGDRSKHLLPSDLTSLCENLVVRRFKRRQLAGQSSQSLEGANTAGWRNELDADDLDVIAHYRAAPIAF